jgi:predicted dehydrogenase
MNKIFKVGLIGCGHIAETYFRAHKYFNNFKIIKCADINHQAAKKCAKRYKIENLSVNNLVKDKNIEIILNLTPPKAHFQIAKKSLLNGKHVYSEKPLSINLFEGKELLKISQKKKLYLGNAPDTFLGGGNQKSKELLENKIIGKVNLGNVLTSFLTASIENLYPQRFSKLYKIILILGVLEIIVE